MTPAEILLISQIAQLAVQAVSSLIQVRQSLGTAATATEQANLASAHTNFQNIVAAATTALTPAA